MRYLILLLELLLILSFFFAWEGGFLADFSKQYPAIFVFGKFLVFLAIVDALRRSVSLWYTRRFSLGKELKTNFEYGVDNIAKVVVFMGTLVFLFQLFGIDIRTLLTSLSIVAAAIAVITKEYINDFLVGLYFSFSRNFEINDYVKIGEHKGKIMELQILKLRLLNDDDDSVILPNSKVYNSEITNYTRRDIRLMSIDFEISTNSIGTIEQLESDLSSSLTDFMEYIEPGSFNLRIVHMKKDLVELKFQYFLKKFDRELQREIRKKTVRQVFNRVTMTPSKA